MQRQSAKVNFGIKMVAHAHHPLMITTISGSIVSTAHVLCVLAFLQHTTLVPCRKSPPDVIRVTFRPVHFGLMMKYNSTGHFHPVTFRNGFHPPDCTKATDVSFCPNVGGSSPKIRAVLKWSHVKVPECLKSLSASKHSKLMNAIIIRHSGTSACPSPATGTRL